MDRPRKIQWIECAAIRAVDIEVGDYLLLPIPFYVRPVLQTMRWARVVGRMITGNGQVVITTRLYGERTYNLQDVCIFSPAGVISKEIDIPQSERGS